MTETTAPGPLALVGSGEFLPAMAAVDAALLEGRPARVAVIPTAAGPEGDHSVGRWFRLAHGHYGGLGADVVEVDVRQRVDADLEAMTSILDDVGLIYLSGGNPAFLADTLRGTVLGQAISRAWRSGTAVAGCSAGAMALGARTLSIRGSAVDGLGLAGRIVTIPHFDKLGFARRMAGALGSLATPDDDVVVGIDEETAVVWDPIAQHWSVVGAAKAWILSSTGGRDDGVGDGSPINLPMPAVDH